MAEARAYGTYNATGPDFEMSAAGMLYGIRAVTTTGARLRFATQAFLTENEVAPWAELPVWVPGSGETAGFSRIDCKKAIQAGLSFRPLATTAADTIAWWNSLPAERRTLRAGLKPDRERELLAKL
jgi:2'-hydroxyisoflavone reductase